MSGRFRDQSGFVGEEARRHGAVVAGKVFINSCREQPAGKRQINVWDYPANLLVLQRRRWR